MSVDENVMFEALLNKLYDQNRPIEDVLRDVSKAKTAFIESEKNANAQKQTIELKPAFAPVVEPAPQLPEKTQASEKELTHYTRNDLKYDPKTAVKEDTIICCLCGAEKKRLTKAHFGMHGTTPEEYRKLCGYDKDLPLSGRSEYLRMRQVLSRANAEQQKNANKPLQEPTQLEKPSISSFSFHQEDTPPSNG